MPRRSGPPDPLRRTADHRFRRLSNGRYLAELVRSPLTREPGWEERTIAAYEELAAERPPTVADLARYAGVAYHTMLGRVWILRRRGRLP